MSKCTLLFDLRRHVICDLLSAWGPCMVLNHYNGDVNRKQKGFKQGLRGFFTILSAAALLTQWAGGRLSNSPQASVTTSAFLFWVQQSTCHYTIASVGSPFCSAGNYQRWQGITEALWEWKNVNLSISVFTFLHQTCTRRANERSALAVSILVFIPCVPNPGFQHQQWSPRQQKNISVTRDGFSRAILTQSPGSCYTIYK